MVIYLCVCLDRCSTHSTCVDMQVSATLISRATSSVLEHREWNVKFCFSIHLAFHFQFIRLCICLLFPMLSWREGGGEGEEEGEGEIPYNNLIITIFIFIYPSVHLSIPSQYQHHTHLPTHQLNESSSSTTHNIHKPNRTK